MSITDQSPFNPLLYEPPVGYASRVPMVAEADELVQVGPDYLGREAWLTPETAHAWQTMRDAALAGGVELWLVSAFRSIARQRELLMAKLAKGMTLEAALEYSAFPGYSEHHSGRAIDIGTPGSPVLEEEFELTTAFCWLQERAGEFGFHMTYSRDNPYGIAYEPWHWCCCSDNLPLA